MTGERITINSNLSPEQAAWNLRSAYNVAALNCIGPQYATLVEDYGAYLKTHQKELREVNTTLDKKFQAEHGRSTYIGMRESYQTSVYNYFALPPMVNTLCSSALTLAQEIKTIPAGELVLRSPAELAKVEALYLDFFNRFDAYKSGFDAWQVEYYEKFGTWPAAGFYLPGEQRYTPPPVQPVVDPSAEAALQTPELATEPVTTD